MADTISHLHCYCGAVREPADLLASTTLPITSEFCHCNPCRQTTGCLGGTFAALAGQPSAPSRAACTRYPHRPDGGRIDRFFCATCGTRTFEHDVRTDRWYAQMGILEPRATASPPPAVVRVSSHAFVADTGDGGLAPMLRRLGAQRVVPCYAEAEGASAAMSAEALAALAGGEAAK
jgi:hypothetical protein